MSNTQQPAWKFLANLGDVSPVDYGGHFVFVDATGVYSPEVEVLIPGEEDDDDDDDEISGWTVYRYILEPCTFRDGILSDNPFHPDCRAWFAESLQAMADCCGTDSEELISLFCSADPLERAQAWRHVLDYFGPDELDSYPLQFTDRAEVESRYSGCV